MNAKSERKGRRLRCLFAAGAVVISQTAGGSGPGYLALVGPVPIRFRAPERPPDPTIFVMTAMLAHTNKAAALPPETQAPPTPKAATTNEVPPAAEGQAVDNEIRVVSTPTIVAPDTNFLSSQVLIQFFRNMTPGKNGEKATNGASPIQFIPPAGDLNAAPVPDVR